MHQKLSHLIQYNPSTIHPLLQINPQSNPFICIAENYLEQIKLQRIEPVPQVIGFRSSLVELSNGQSLQVDDIIFATGFSTRLDFFSEKILKQLNYLETDKWLPVPLYHGVFHPEFPKLAFIGFYRSPFFGVFELQSRWACRVFAKMVNPPAKEDLKQEIKKLLIARTEPREVKPQYPYGDYVELANELARLSGVYPLNQKEYERLVGLPVVPALYGLVDLFNPSKDNTVAMKIINQVESLMLSQKPMAKL
jgi:dimethylaniline monooxygenase (N-oxide forming)